MSSNVYTMFCILSFSKDIGFPVKILYPKKYIKKPDKTKQTLELNSKRNQLNK